MIIRAKVGSAEFNQLHGNLDNICMVAVDTITEPVKVTKTGARHSHAKWFLLPVRMRTRYKADEYDYEGALAGHIEYKDQVLFVYMVGRKVFGE
jgi:hypothetical protein